MGGLLSFDGTDATFPAARCYRMAKAALQALSGSYETIVAFSAQLKHTLLYVHARYAFNGRAPSVSSCGRWMDTRVPTSSALTTSKYPLC